MSSISAGTSGYPFQANQFQVGAAGAGATQHGHHHHGSGAMRQAFARAAEEAGVDPSKVADLQKQIDQAVQQARQNGGSGDPRTAIQNAINGVLQKNGIDSTKFDDAMKAEFQKMAAQRKGSRGGPDGDADDAPPSATVSSGTPTVGLDATA